MKKLLCTAIVALFFATSVFAQVPQQQNTYPQQTQPQATPPNQQQNTYPQQNNRNQSVLPQGNPNTMPQNQNVGPPPSSADTTITPYSNRRSDTGTNPNSNRVGMDTTRGRGTGTTDSSENYNPPRL